MGSFFRRIVLLLAIVSILGGVLSQFAAPGNRIYSGDATCVCGIDSALLDRLEALLKALPEHSCPAPALIDQPQAPSSSQEQEQKAGNAFGNSRPANNVGLLRPAQVQNVEPQKERHEIPAKASSHQVDSPAKHESLEESHDPHRPDQSQIASIANSSDRHPSRPSEQHDHPVSSIGGSPSSEGQTTIKRPIIPEETQIRPSTGAESEPESESESESDPSEAFKSEPSQDNTGPINAGFLEGLAISPSSSHNQALAKLNQSSSNVSEKDMANALASTVPNLVSNIFSNIKNLTIQTEQNPNRPLPNILTSIDGSTMDVHGNSKDQITADGEKLFDIWLEHQLETLHLTAAMANHIRKSAGILFRRIIKQYVERVERMGGKVEQNIQRATQMALNNTQLLIEYLMKNYVYFAAGIMQILGEQVSRVGKQIDSTGDTIAHMSLNPFDIISNVIESLPNPSDYSNYFRNFGKHLLGEVNAFGNGPANVPGGQSSQQGSASSQPGSTQPGGLITKTIGAISKFGSWLG